MNIQKITSLHEYSIALAIRRKVFIEEQSVPIELEIDPFQGENFLIWEKNEALGTARYQVKEELIKFERVAVLKSHREKGFGKALMLAMQKDADVGDAKRRRGSISQSSPSDASPDLGHSIL